MTAQTMNPAAAGTADGARDARWNGERPNDSTTGKRGKASLTVRLGDGTVTVQGRMAQTLSLLIRNGPKGFTSGEASPLGWARRTSHYVMELRRLGFPIVTHWEAAGDARVGRYVLTAPVVILAGGAG